MAMVIIDEKFKAAISDTDILLDLFKCEAFEILGLLFHKIYIPEFIYEKELKRVARRHKDISVVDLQSHLEAKNGLFEIVYDNELDITTKNIKKALVQERKDLVGPGEVECACFAKASAINFVVSNNHTEFRFLNDIAVMLTYYHVLSICVFHNKINKTTAATLYDKVNSIKTNPSHHTFEQKLDHSWDYFCDSDYLEVLRLTHLL